MKKIILSYLMAISMFSPNLSNANMLNSSHYSATYFANGINYYNKGEYNNAIEEFSQIIIMLPDFAPAYYLRGFAYNDKGEYVNATNDFKRACDLKYEDGCKALRIIS